MAVNPNQSRGLLGLLLLLSLTGLSARTQEAPPKKHPSIQLPGPLERVLRDYEVAWGNKDAAGLAALFTEDGFVLSGGRPPVRGRIQIGKRYSGSGGPLALRPLAYATEGDIGYIIGAFARQRGESDVGKFTLTLRRISGRWFIMSDMDNGNTSGG